MAALSDERVTWSIKKVALIPFSLIVPVYAVVETIIKGTTGLDKSLEHGLFAMLVDGVTIFRQLVDEYELTPLKRWGQCKSTHRNNYDIELKRFSLFDRRDYVAWKGSVGYKLAEKQRFADVNILVGIDKVASIMAELCR